jgi:protein required for attachment to host cells
MATGESVMALHTAWVVVADAKSARVLEREHPGAEWVPLPVETLATRAPARAMRRPGYHFAGPWDSGFGARPAGDVLEVSRSGFARQLCDRLESAALAGRYGRLMLVAPPGLLGDLREEMGDATCFRLRGTLDRNLIDASVEEVVQHLPELLPA